MLKVSDVKSRWLAFAIHLFASFILFLILAAIIKFAWYPSVLFATEGGLEGIKLIAGVDLVIGPTLTLLVYNVQKKELPRDLAIIGFMQVACVIFGMYTVAWSRPIAVIYGNDIFFVSTQTQYLSYDIKVEDVPHIEGRWPAQVGLNLPMEPEKRKEVAIKYHTKGDIRNALDLYEPFEKTLPRLKNEGYSLEHAENKLGIFIPEALKQRPNTRIFNLATRYDGYLVAVDVNDGSFIQLVDYKTQEQATQEPSP